MRIPTPHELHKEFAKDIVTEWLPTLKRQYVSTMTGKIQFQIFLANHLYKQVLKEIQELFLAYGWDSSYVSSNGDCTKCTLTIGPKDKKNDFKEQIDQV